MPEPQGVPHQPQAPQAPRALFWLSRDLSEFAAETAAGPPGADEAAFDVLIVGSGYGAGMALNGLAGQGIDGRALRIAVLERGKEYLPGTFPSRAAELQSHVRFNVPGVGARGRKDGLFDFRIGPDCLVLVANGLGGGSLINAGVTAWPHPTVFQDERWPTSIRQDAGLEARSARVAQLLEANSSVGLQRHQGVAQREAAMNAAAVPGTSDAADITVAGTDDPARGILACNGCGDCATGCNFRAKLSVDVTLLARARAAHPPDCLEILTGATATAFERDDAGGGWKVFVVHTDERLRRARVGSYMLRARRLILAAGTLGTTELLMRARDRGLPVSGLLGERFSANGDNLAAIYKTASPVGAVADEAAPFAQRGVGPTITRILDLRRGDPVTDLVIEDMAVPGALRRVFEEAVTTASLLQSLTRGDTRVYQGGPDEEDAAAIDGAAVDHSFLVALISRDAAAGTLALNGAPEADDGALVVHWPSLRGDPRLDGHQRTLQRLVAQGLPPATVLPNPLWRPVPAEFEALFGKARGPALSVHPLGGCPMGENGAAGVVNHLGQVFSGTGSEVYDDLVVMDGAMVPTSLGINPSLTIATLAHRAMEQLRGLWGFHAAAAPAMRPWPRPEFRQMPEPMKAPSTQLSLTERMSGRVMLAQPDGRPLDVRVELELWFMPESVDRLVGRNAPRQLRVAPDRSRLRVYGAAAQEPRAAPPEDAPSDHAPPGAAAPNAALVGGVSSSEALLCEAVLEGDLTLMRHEPSGPVGRAFRAGRAWFFNRGLRDAVRTVRDLLHGNGGPGVAPWTLAAVGWRFATHAGDVRTMEYRLKPMDMVAGSAGKPSMAPWLAEALAGSELRVLKRVAYERAANPTNQLMYARLTAFPRLAGPSAPAELAVDLPFFSNIGVALARLSAQASRPDAWTDIVSTALYLVRALLPIHLWTLRTPDRPAPRVADRLPGAVAGLPAPEVHTLPVDTLEDGTPVHLRLTRYRPAELTSPHPVLLLHGYSASGTTFVHPALPDGGLVGALCARGHDVWVLDMRSSAGMPGAQQFWWFEQMGCQDIPLAAEHVAACTGQEKLDIVSHCMGSAMLSLGLFGRWREPNRFDRFPQQRAQLARRLRRLVLCQVGPALVMSPANTARAFAFEWLRHYIGLGAWEFTPRGTPTVSDDMLDRLLALVPYPPRDFARENPFWPPWKRTPWVGARHRMDALYGITFKLDEVPDPVLEAIDDFFGPMNLQTVTQVIHFARDRVVTDHRGDGSAIAPDNMRRVLAGRRVLCLHAVDNGLVNIATRPTLSELLMASGARVDSTAFDGLGHQDSLIGSQASRVYAKITKFLNQAESP